MATSEETAVNVADAKRRFSDLLGRVAYGRETILITRRGRPMARLVPVEPRTAVVEKRRKPKSQQLQEIVHEKHAMLERAPHAAVPSERVRSEAARPNAVSQVELTAGRRALHGAGL